MSNKRNLIVGAVVVVAVVIGYVALTGKYPPKNGTQGAIGAVDRYQAQQMSASDVTLKDSKIQAFLQTDLFHKVATNAKFRQLVKNPKFQALAKDKNFLALAADPDVGQFLSKSEKLFERQDFDAMLKSKKFNEVAEQEKLVHLLKEKHFANLASDQDFVALLQDPNFDAMMEQAETQKATTVQKLNEIAETEKGTKLKNLSEMEKKKAFIALLETNELQEAASQGDLADLAELLQTTDVEALLQDDSFQELLGNPKALKLVGGGDEMAQVVQNLEELANDSSAGELFAVFGDASVMEAFANSEMEEIASAGLLEEAVSHVEN